MSEVEKKLVNVEQLGILHEHNKQAYIAKNQGTENVGKVLAVDTEGTATPMSAPEVMDITYYEDENGKVLEFVSKEQLPGNVGIDSSLTLKGNAADAKVVGDILRRLNGGTGTGGSGGTLLPEDIEKAVEEYLKENPIDVKAIDVLDMIYDSQNQIIEFVDADSPFIIDPYLSTAGSAADAKAVGDALAAQAEYNELTYAKKGEVTNPDGTVNYDLAVVDDGQGNLVFGSDISEVYSTDSKYSIYDNTDSGLSATNVQDAIDELKSTSENSIELSEIFNAIYPVGAIYMSANSINPSLLFGGTWVPWGGGRVPVGVGSNGTTEYSTVEAIGGAESRSHNHEAKTSGEASGNTGTNNGKTGAASGNTGATTLTIDQIPSHRHAQTEYWGAGSGGAYTQGAEMSTATPYGTMNSYTRYVGGDKSHTHTLNSHTHTLNSHSHSLNSHTHSVPASDNQTTDVRQPYITCYMWKRTA